MPIQIVTQENDKLDLRWLGHPQRKILRRTKKAIRAALGGSPAARNLISCMKIVLVYTASNI